MRELYSSLLGTYNSLCNESHLSIYKPSNYEHFRLIFSVEFFGEKKKRKELKQLRVIIDRNDVLKFSPLIFQIKIMNSESWTLPPKQGLYDPTLEREACGVGFIVAIDGKRSHKVSRF